MPMSSNLFVDLLDLAKFCTLLNACFSEGHVRMLEECVQDAMTEHNKLAVATDKYAFYCIALSMHHV